MIQTTFDDLMRHYPQDSAYDRLVKNNIVTFAGNCARRMGHGAAGGRLYEVVR